MLLLADVETCCSCACSFLRCLREMSTVSELLELELLSELSSCSMLLPARLLLAVVFPNEGFSS